MIKPQKPKLVSKVKQILHRMPAGDWGVIRDWLNNNLANRKHKDQVESIKRVGAGHKVVIVETSRPDLLNKICTVIRYGPKNVSLEVDKTKGQWRVRYERLRPLTDMVLERATGGAKP